jgi:hypothetical protein
MLLFFSGVLQSVMGNFAYCTGTSFPHVHSGQLANCILFNFALILSSVNVRYFESVPVVKFRSTV